MSDEKIAPKKQRRRGCLRALLVLTVLALAVLVALAALLASGAMEERVAPHLAERLFGAGLEWEVSQWVSPLRIRRLAVYDPAGESRSPLLAVEGLEAEYRLSPFAARQFGRVSVASVSIHADGANPEDTNYDFLLDLISGPSEAGAGGRMPARWVPEKVHVTELSAGAVLPDWTLALSGAAFNL